MSLPTFLFLLFLAIVVIVNTLIPRIHRWIWWLISSYAFCIFFDLKSSLVLLAITLEAYLFGLLINKEQNYKKKKVSLVFGLVILIGSLFFFKYLNFSITIINDLFTLSGGTFKYDLINLLLPVGLSFYTFQAISYLVDIYNGTIQAEKNFGKVALFLAFFPKLLSGPIERGAHLLPQLSDPVPFEYHRFVSALLHIFWGFFKKLVIADRLSIPVATVFSSPADFFAPQSIFAAIAFSLQIYIDFSAYCDIAIGAASILGVDLVENFNLPYLAKSVTEFWRRWHMSFSNWLRDYLFIPLNFTVRRKRSGFLKYAIIMVVFLVSGIWHGANYTFYPLGFAPWLLSGH